jgi:predicted DNA-binding transcriptional regulator YafY
MSDTPGRLLRLLSLLQQRATWSGPELADRLGVTTRTVRRDVERLRALGYRVDAGPGSAGGYRLGIGAAVPPLVLGDDEATAIALALGAWSGGALAGMAEPAVAVLAKLDRLLPPHVRARVDAVRRTTLPIGGFDAVAPDVLVTLARAAAEQERLRVAYVDRLGRRTERRIDPYRLVPTGRRWYLVAWDVDRAGWRTFRADRVSEVAATGHRFRLDDPPDAAELVSRASGVAPYPHVARVVVATTPEHLAARVPPTVGVVEPHAGGALLTVGANDLAGLAGHLIALDLPFEALEPPELRDLLRRAARRLTETHG